MFSVRSRVINFVDGWYCRCGYRMRILYCVCVVETFSVGLCCAFNRTEGIVKSFVSTAIISFSVACSRSVCIVF